jgi:hypothetical protein
MDKAEACMLHEDPAEDRELSRELENKRRELSRVRAELEAVEKDRDAWREAAGRVRKDNDLQGCLGVGRTGLIRAMRKAFA